MESIALQAKMFYQEFDAGDTLHEINLFLLDNIIAKQPMRVFEFGCNNGKNLLYLKKYLPHALIMGLDVSSDAVDKAREKGLMVHWGDERHLECFRHRDFDIVFTNSVLCHIPDIDSAVESMQRMTDRILIAETNEILGKFYFKHDYSKYGFRKIKSIKAPDNPVGNGATYDIMEWNHK